MTDAIVVLTVKNGNIDPAALVNQGTPSTGMVASEHVTIAVNGILEIEPDVYGVNVIGVEGSRGEEFTDYLIVVRDGDHSKIGSRAVDPSVNQVADTNPPVRISDRRVVISVTRNPGRSSGSSTLARRRAQTHVPPHHPAG